MYLGLDLGTSGLRGVVADAEGALLADAEVPLSRLDTLPGWSEQDPHSWIDACQKVVASLRSCLGEKFSGIKAIGMSGHMHGATLIDDQDEVLRPCMLWNDVRSASQAVALDQITSMRNISGNVVFPGFTAPKVSWVRDEEPAVFDRIAKVLLPKDYLRFWLTGDYITDCSDAAGTSWLDVRKRTWSSEALALTGLAMGQMPDVVEGSAMGGNLRKSLLEQWGLTGPVVVAGGAADNAAAACGVGCLREGQGFVSLGTSGVLLAGRDDCSPDPETAVHTFCHAVPDSWYQMGVILSATDSLNWLARSMGKNPAELSSLMPETITGPSSVTFLPYLSGERTPHNDAGIRGAFVGLDVADGPEVLVQAVMEGVAFALRDSQEALANTGAKLETALALGGGARSRFWLESIATIMDMPMLLPEGSELGAAMGAVRLAQCADTGALPDEVMTAPKVGDEIRPIRQHSDAYQDAYGRYRRLYPLLSELDR